MHIGKIIKVLRVQRQLSQEQLALEVGIATSNISRIEGGKRQPSISLVSKLARALGTTPAGLYALSEQEATTSETLLSEDSLVLLKHFSKLSDKNKSLAIEHIKMLHRLEQEKDDF